MFPDALRPLACLSLASLLVGASGGVRAAQTSPPPAAVARHEARRADLAAASRRLAAVRPAMDHGPVSMPTPRGGPVPEPGDLVTSAGILSRTLRVVQRNRRGRIVRQSLAEDFVSRGIAYDPLTGLVAIAAIDRVLLLDPATAATTVITEMAGGERLQFANDVVFDGDGLLIIADQGASSTGVDPTDGRIWEYDPASGAVQRLAGRRKLSNPSLLAADSRGRVYVVDAEAGRLVSPLLELRWDTLYRLRGAQRKGARRIYRDDGIQATAFDIGPDDRMWFGNLSEIAILEDKSLSLPCPLIDLPFEFISGIAVLADNDARVADGSDVVTRKRKIFDVDDQCSARVRFKGHKLNEIRGLTRVAAPAGE